MMGEFLQSQCEVATLPHHDIRPRSRNSRSAPDRSEDRRRARAGDSCSRHASDRRLEPVQQPRRTLRRRDGRPADDRPAQHAVRAARACRTARPRRPRRRHEPHAALSAAVPRARDLLAVLASRPTGLKGYRLAAYDELPRTGVPELFRTKEEFDAYVDALVKAGVMKDSSYIWWSMRPSLKHPTLELRAPDCSRWSRTRSRSRRCTDAGAAARPQPGPTRHQRRHPRHRGREQMAGATLRRARHLRRRRRRDHRRRIVEQVMRRPRPTPRRSAPRRDAAVPHHRGAGTSADAQIAVYEKNGKTEGRAGAFSAVTDWIAATMLQ